MYNYGSLLVESQQKNLTMPDVCKLFFFFFGSNFRCVFITVITRMCDILCDVISIMCDVILNCT